MKTIDSVAKFSAQLRALDLSLMSAVPATAMAGDRCAFLASHSAVRQPGYTYLEIGSEQGGSFKTHLRDSWGQSVFSIDLSVDTAPDSRGTQRWYDGNSTAALRATLAKASSNRASAIGLVE